MPPETEILMLPTFPAQTELICVSVKAGTDPVLRTVEVFVEVQPVFSVTVTV